MLLFNNSKLKNIYDIFNSNVDKNIIAPILPTSNQNDILKLKNIVKYVDDVLREVDTILQYQKLYIDVGNMKLVINSMIKNLFSRANNVIDVAYKYSISYTNDSRIKLYNYVYDTISEAIVEVKDVNASYKIKERIK